MINYGIRAGSIILPNDSVRVATLRVSAPFRRVGAYDAAQGVGCRVFSPSTTRDNGGNFMHASLTGEEGEILMLQVTRSRNGALLAQAAAFLRLRQGAACLSVRVSMPSSPLSRMGQFVEGFIGRADLLDLEELARFGIQVPENYARVYMNLEELEEVFHVEIMQRELSPMPTYREVATSTGTRTVAVLGRPVRKVRRRRQ